MKEELNDRRRGSERGGAGVKLLIVAVAIILVGNAGYQYVPVAYQGEAFQQDMDTAVVQAVAMPGSYGKTVDVVKQKIVSAAGQNDIPLDFRLDVNEKNKTIVARVSYVKNVPLLPFGIYNYEYVFDHTSTPNGFLTD